MTVYFIALPQIFDFVARLFVFLFGVASWRALLVFLFRMSLNLVDEI